MSAEIRSEENTMIYFTDTYLLFSQNNSIVPVHYFCIFKIIFDPDGNLENMNSREYTRKTLDMRGNREQQNR